MVWGVRRFVPIPPRPCSVALVDNFLAPVPFAETPEHITAAQQAFHTLGTNGGVIFPALTGEYSPLMLEHLGENAPDVEAGGIWRRFTNRWMPLASMFIRAFTCEHQTTLRRGYEVLPFPKGYPRLQHALVACGTRLVSTGSAGTSVIL